MVITVCMHQQSLWYFGSVVPCRVVPHYLMLCSVAYEVYTPILVHKNGDMLDLERALMS